MNKSSPEELLDAKTRALEHLVQQRRFGPEYRALHDEVLNLERVIADSRGEPHAVEFSLGENWGGMAHFSTVVGNSFGCAVVLVTQTREHVALGFSSVAGYKLTDVSDEIIQGHPLTGKGLTAYGAFVVRHSPWINELELIDRVHPQHSAARWRASRHYLLAFKDRMFEAIAQDVQHIGTFGGADEAFNRALEHVGAKRVGSAPEAGP
jgi:hypothetical protein